MSDYHASGCMSNTHNHLTGEREIKITLAVLDLDWRQRNWERWVWLTTALCSRADYVSSSRT